MGRCRMLEKVNAQLNDAAVKVSNWFQKKGFRTCILKGRGNALMYPNPYSRTPGDIDIWVEGGDKRVISFVRSISPHEKASYHHIEFPSYKGVEIEVHYRPSFLLCFWHNRKLQEYYEMMKEEQFSHRVMLAGIREILIISTPYDLPGFKRLLGDGSQFGVKFEYVEQPSPDGLAQAFIIGEKFIGNDSACLVLGDNIFYGAGLNQMLHHAVVDAEQNNKATVFGYRVSDPERYGVAEFDEQGNCLSIEEKPQHPKSNYAVVGLYFYPNKVVEVAKHTHDSLSEASTFIEVLEKRQGLKVACLEDIAYRQGWIDSDTLRENAHPMLKNDYGKYLLSILEEKDQTLKKNLEY